MARRTATPVFPATVVIDTREQRMYRFRSIVADTIYGGERGALLTVPTTIEGLASGDYSLYGYADKVAVERKSKADLFSTISQGRDRFERELARLNEMEFAAVVVEAEWSDIVNERSEHSALSPKTVFRSVLAWQQRFVRVHWWFVAGREFGEATTFRILERYLKERADNESH